MACAASIVPLIRARGPTARTVTARQASLFTSDALVSVRR